MTAATTTEQSCIRLIGKAWPDRPEDTYAGIMHAGGLLYHLFVESNSMDKSGLKWGPYNKVINGADSTWDGLANTRALIASGLVVPAAQYAADGEIVEDDGWYLPAQRELALCWATVPEIFHTDDWYWSSTQYSASNAWMQYFRDGSQYVNDKTSTARVRRVRRSIIQ